MNPPLEFSGSADKAHDFLWQVELYITCKKDQFKDDTTHIAWTLSSIWGGPGGVWAGTYIDALTTTLDSGATPQHGYNSKSTSSTSFFPKNETKKHTISSSAFFKGEVQLRTM